MKFITGVLALSLAVFGFSNAQAVGGFLPIKFDPNNQQLVDTLNYGLEEAIQDQIGEGQISDDVWVLTEVVSVSQQVVAGMNYDFVVDIGDQNGDEARLDFIVYDSLDGQKTLIQSETLKMGN